MIRVLAKTAVVVLFFLLFCVSDASSLTLDDLTTFSLPSDAISETLPFSNITVYKRWNEDEIPWDVWFRRAYLPILIFVASSFGIIVLFFVNNLRLKKLVKKGFQDVWEAEENYYRLLEVVSDAVIIIDPEDKRIVGANKQAEKLTGYKRLDLLDLNLFSITLSSAEKEINELLREIKLEHYINDAGLDILTQDKKVIKTSFNGRFIKGYSRTIILLSFLKTDQAAAKTDD